MKNFYYLIIITISLMLLNTSLLFCDSSVKINEIFYNPENFPEHYYEWVEIYNTGTSEVNISSWSFIVGTSTYAFKPFNKTDSILTSQSFAVLVTSGSSFLAHHAGFDALLLEFTKTVRLSNQGKYIALKDENSTTVESLTYDPQWNNNVEDKSIERKDTGGLSDDPSSWQESAAAGGTPGRANSQGVLPDDGEEDDDAGGEETDEVEEEEAPDEEGDITLVADSFTAVITEVAPSESGGKDWIEIFIVEQTDISSFSLYERETKIKVFPEVLAEEGSYLVVHCNQDYPDETSDTNSNGYLDFYSSDSGLTGTDNVISLRESDGGIIDALIFSNYDRERFVPRKSYDACVEAQVWEPPVTSGEVQDYESGSADWSEGKAGYSLSRIRGADGNPNATRPGSSSFWVLNRYPNQGGGYGYTQGSTEDIIGVVEPNPFSPDDADPAKRFAQVNFHVPQGTVKTLYIFDVHGRERIKLIDHDASISGESWQGIDAGQVLWDGRDKNGEKLPVGIYILYMEAVDPLNGAEYQGKDTVVIGKKLR